MQHHTSYCGDVGDVIDGCEHCDIPDESGDAVGLNDEEEDGDGGDYPAGSSSFMSSETIKVAGFAIRDAVIWSTDEQAGHSDDVYVPEGGREADCEVVGELADDALHLVQLDGRFY